MVIETLRVTVLPANLREILQTLHDLADSIQTQRGCQNYHFYTDMEDENAVCVIGEWKTRADFNNHLLSREFAVLLGAVRLLGDSTEMEFQLLSPTDGIEIIDAVRGKAEP